MIVARLALILVVLAVAAPAAAFAQSDPFGPLPPAPAPQQPVQTTSNTASNANDGGGLKRWQEILIFAGGGILLVGIGWAIVTDARRNAPVEEREGATAAKAAREADHHRRKQVARQKAKAARASRKRNR